MGMTTLGNRAPERPAASTYWRRRFVALVAGLSVLALVTWALSGAMGGSAPTADSGATKPVHGTLASPSAHPRAHPQPTTGSRPAGTPHRSGSAPGVAAPRPCPASSVVLSVDSSQGSYSVRQSPEFAVNVVSVASQTCTFNIGAKHVWLQISAGPVRIWSSAECAEGEASAVTQLRRGVPTVVPIGWNGQISGPGCPGPGTRAAAGSYTAMASDGSASSNTLVFRIG
jgi:hypothetical protein